MKVFLPFLALLQLREPGATSCPSEVATALAAKVKSEPLTEWRDAMPVVHAARDQLVDEGTIHLSWKGDPLATRNGPYRIHRS